MRSLEPSFRSPAEWEVAGRLQADYEQRSAHFAEHVEGAEPLDDARLHEIERSLRGEAYQAERRALHELRRTGEVGDDVYRRIEWDLDLAESRLE